MKILSEIPFTLEVGKLSDEYKIRPGTELARRFTDLAREVQATGNPKVMYKVSYIDEKGEDTVKIDDTLFTSLALKKNLDQVKRVFPYIATCGTEVDNIKIDKGDMLKSFWMFNLKGILLQSAIIHLFEHIDKHYKTGKLSSMNPGSGDEVVWPIVQQKNLFSLFKDVKAGIGVGITDSSLLVPETSLIGIIFQTEIDFQSCQLCHRENCPQRRTSFDKTVWKSIYEN
ncbi:MAG: hypothetical protein KJ737_09680 [Proteobacteria bacterium]|nr:hypothetical protein [Pseudomonadota bacterium]